MTATSLRLACAGAVLAGVLAAPATASELIDRNATGVKLGVSRSGVALLTYRARGGVQHVLARGAINAIPPSRTRRQVQFQLDYKGGWGFYRRANAWRSHRNACRPYDGPDLHWFVTGCKASDGSYWAIQAWQRALPNYGVRASRKQSVWELRLSHWRGPIPVLDIKLDWAYRSYHHLYGTLSYLGLPVHGFRSTPQGVTLDSHGRNIYVDTYNSAYGRGWKRENSFLTHNSGGNFCYGFYRHFGRPTGRGSAYRATVIGPGVTPDPFWQAQSPGDYNRELDLLANEEQQQAPYRDGLCRPN